MKSLLLILSIIVLDLFIGDPEMLPHPVKIFGRIIEESEGWLRSRFSMTPKGEFRAGLILAIALPVLTLVSTGLIMLLLYEYCLPLAVILQIFWGWQSIAIKDMIHESNGVHAKVTSGDLSGARAAVGRIVGRDTKDLGFEGIIKATVETVAESFSDGYFAPLFYFAIGGAPLALTYKAINTMDSMIGYDNKKYEYFGKAAARLDDAANYIPSRISAFLLMGASRILGYDEKNAYRIWLRDRKKSTSPNSGQTESVMAGALHVRLLGPAYYFGEYHDKPYIGEDIRPVEAYDIKRANNMFVVGALIGMILAVIIRVIIV